MKKALKHASRWVAGLLPAALLAGLGMPALAALVFLAVLMLGIICWVIKSADRVDRVSRMILAVHGDASCLAPAPSAPSSPNSRRYRRRPEQSRQAARQGSDADGPLPGRQPDSQISAV